MYIISIDLPVQDLWIKFDLQMNMLTGLLLREKCTVLPLKNTQLEPRGAILGRTDAKQSQSAAGLVLASQ